MAGKKTPHPLRASEIKRSEPNLANWLKLDSEESMYHCIQGVLESQIVTSRYVASSSAGVQLSCTSA